MDQIADLLDILANPARITKIIGDELTQIREQYGDPRRSEIVVDAQELSLEDLITPADVVVTLSHSGYIKSQPLVDYRAQKRGGRGKQATATKEDDFIDNLFIANTHDYILCFSSLGRLYWIKVYEVPQGTRASRGKPIVNLVQLEDGEKINAILPVKVFDDEHFVFMATANGTVKKTPLSDFSRPRATGIFAVDLDHGRLSDRRGVDRRQARHHVVLRRWQGGAVLGGRRPAHGAQCPWRARHAPRHGAPGDLVARGRGREPVCADRDGERLRQADGGGGIHAPRPRYAGDDRHPDDARNGAVVAASLVRPEDEVMLITTGGVLIRTRVSEIREMSRSTQGVTLINLDQGEKLAGLETGGRDRRRRG